MICLYLGDPRRPLITTLPKWLTASEQDLPEVPKIDGRDGSTARNGWLSAVAPGALWDLFALRLSASAAERGADYSSSRFLTSATMESIQGTASGSYSDAVFQIRMDCTPICSTINALIAEMDPDEIQVPQLVDAWLRAGWMDEAEAAEWQLGALAWAEFHSMSQGMDPS